MDVLQKNEKIICQSFERPTEPQNEVNRLNSELDRNMYRMEVQSEQDWKPSGNFRLKVVSYIPKLNFPLLIVKVSPIQSIVKHNHQ